MTDNNSISVVINTRNARRHLETVLEAVKDFDEVLVCDMESTDDTVEIAKNHGCRVVTFPAGSHKIAEPARTFAIRQAHCPWVLVVDADEIITPELRRYLYERIAQPGMPAGLYIMRHNKLFGKYGRDWSNDYQLRFFKRDGTEWPPVVHSFPKVDGPTERAPRRYAMMHLQDETTAQWVAKMNGYTDHEVIKKQDRRFGCMALLWRPLWRFFASYVLHGGFLNGRRGLLQATQWAVYQAVLVSKIIEKEVRKGQ